jgi:hypothetical protein
MRSFWNILPSPGPNTPAMTPPATLASLAATQIRGVSLAGDGWPVRGKSVGSALAGQCGPGWEADGPFSWASCRRNITFWDFVQSEDSSGRFGYYLGSATETRKVARAKEFFVGHTNNESPVRGVMGVIPFP